MDKEDPMDPVAAQGNLRDVMRKEIIQKFYARSDWEGLKQVVFYFSCLILTSSLMRLSQEVFTWTAALLFHSFMISFMFMGLHETVHGTAFRSSYLNGIFKIISGFLTLRPPIHYYYYHWAHHRHTGNPGKDPELFNSFIDPQVISVRGYFTYLSGIPFWIDRIFTLFRHTLGIYYNKQDENEYYFNSATATKRCTFEARMFMLLYSACFLIGYHSQPIRQVLLFYWLLPSLIGQPHLRFYLLAEHMGCVAEGANIFDNTRNTSTAELYNKLAWNMPYHDVHHAWPGVPFHSLDKVSEKLTGRESKCDPPGELGYINVNYNIVRRLPF